MASRPVPPARTPRYSYEVSRQQWWLTPGIASERIRHLSVWLATVHDPAIVLWCRETKPNGNLSRHVIRGTASLRALGVTPVAVFAANGKGDVRCRHHKLELAIDTARQLIQSGRPAAVVAEATDRFIRPSSYGATERMLQQPPDGAALAEGWLRPGAGQSNAGRLKRVSLPRIDELELLDQLADGVPLCTVLHPDASSRSAFTADGIATAKQATASRRRGQYQHWTDDDAEAVRRLAQAGHSNRAIARLLNMPEATVRRLKRGR